VCARVDWIQVVQDQSSGAGCAGVDWIQVVRISGVAQGVRE
jgi:hypothetical protein